MKNLKSIFVLFAASAALFVSCNNKPAAEETSTVADAGAPESLYTINTDSTSFVMWKGVMLGIKEHTGKVSFKDGSLSVKGTQLVSGKFTVDMNTVTPLDQNYDEKAGYGKAKLIGHLVSPDFFDVTNFPVATFVLDSVSGNTASGTLTLRGKSNKETLTNITISEAANEIKASGQLIFDRKKYGVAFDMPTKDMVISNDIELHIELTGKK